MSHTITKKLVNATETCVDDNLIGVVAINPQLRLHPKHRVVTVNSQHDTERVAILAGGGSGHEPFATGFVGRGMLDGAVAGGVFASPTTAQVLYAIRVLYKYNSGGVLVVLGNYTGDRLNFGKAIEKAKMEGIKVEGLIVGEDVASSHNKTGGRGMAGEVFIYKLCGCLASEGRDLEYIMNVASKACKYTATLGVCLSACSLPGQPPLFEISNDEMEVGAGVHGEAGIKKIKLGTSAEVVELMLDEILGHLKLSHGSRVGVLVNNLGGTSIMEMNILAGDIKTYLDKNGIKLVRLYTGHLKTSLEMHGFQITVIHLNDEDGETWLGLLDAPTHVTAWTGGPLSIPGQTLNVDDPEFMKEGGSRRKRGLGAKFSANQKDLTKKCLQAAVASLEENVELLNRLDSGCGDGDCGNTLKTLAQAVSKYVTYSQLEFISDIFWDLSEIAERDMGGTSGGIYSLGLSAASQAFAESGCIDTRSWVSAWHHAIDAISKYGGAEQGDRTMLDTLCPALKVFEELTSEDLVKCLKLTLEAAEKGAKSTRNMTAKAGRASYVASNHTRDEDAGARAAAIWMTAILNEIIKAREK